MANPANATVSTHLIQIFIFVYSKENTLVNTYMYLVGQEL